eukprot:41843_1
MKNINISYSSNGVKHISFQKRCTQYTTSAALFGGVKKNQSRLNALFRNKYRHKYKILYKLWTQWNKYAKLMEDKKTINMPNVRFEISQSQQILEDDCADFIEGKTMTQKDTNSIISVFNKWTGKIDKSDEILQKSVTISSLRKQLASPTRSQKAQKIATTSVNILPEHYSEEQLKKVSTREEMKKWIKTFKTHDFDDGSCCNFGCCCACKLIRACFGESCCECKGIINIMEKEDKNLCIPMDLWSWQNVVAAIEDAIFQDENGEIYQLKHFASVFWQYQIEGKELVAMDVLQVELLVECWFLNNIKEQFFDEVKRKSQQELGDDVWDLALEAQRLMKYIDRLRIHSHVVSRYHLSMDIVQLIISEYKDNAGQETINRNINDVYEDAVNIKHCVDLLRANISDGPKQFWKIESHFFNKIDNYLSVLICGETIQDLYLKCFPDFLYEEKIINHDIDSIDHDIPTHNPPLSIQRYRNSYNLINVSYNTNVNMNSNNNNSKSLKMSHSDMNAFHAIQHRLNRSYKSTVFKKQNNTLNMVTDRKWEQDLLDKLTDECCDSGCCVNYDCAGDYTQCIHNLDRVYLKMACLIIIAMLFGCLFITGYYYDHGKDQADDALFLSLESIGDRAAGLMNMEFWVPQMADSLTIGGLTTGDLLTNASLYTAPNYKFDQFFASFSTVQHTAAIFSVFMYNHQLNSMIGAYKEPDMDQLDGHDNGSVIIMYYNGTCRKDRLYDPILRTRVEWEPFTKDNSKQLKNYMNCGFDPKNRKWYTKGLEIGVGKSQWTEPYLFIEKFRGMSYVAPIIWNQQRITFVVEVTTYTLSIAVSREIQNLPGGDDPYALWMIVTPGMNAVASSNNETLIDIPGCTELCTTDDPKMIAGIKYMKNNNITDFERFTGLQIDDDYQLSIYPFKMNDVNLHPKPGYTSNEWIVRPLNLASIDDYQYGYVAIVNDDTYLNDVNFAWYICWIITVLSVGCIIMLILCNIRYNNIQQNKLGRAGRSGIIRATESKRLRIAKSSIHSFTKQISKSRSFSNGEIVTSTPRPENIDTSPLYANNNGSVGINIPIIGDRLKTKNNTYGTVKFVGQLNTISPQSNSSDTSVYVLLEQDNNKGQVLIQLDNVIYNFGQKFGDEHKSEESPSPTPNRTKTKSIKQIPISTRSTIDDKILKTSLTPLKAGTESDEDEDDDDIEESLTDETLPIAGTLQIQSSIPSSVKSVGISNNN